MAAAVPSQNAPSDRLRQSNQLIVVTTSSWSAVEGRLQRYQRGNQHESWRPVGQSIPIVVGRNGLGWGISTMAADGLDMSAVSDPFKHEGDGKAPAGVFALGTTFGYAPQPLQGSKMPYLELTPSTECVDDAGSKHYNHIVDRSTVTPDWKSSERMRSFGESYRWGIVVDLNGTIPTVNTASPVPGGGSCIFLHIWKSPKQGTVGCTAMSQTDLETLLRWLDPKRRPLLVQLPTQEYARLTRRWKLPAFVTAPAR